MKSTFLKIFATMPLALALISGGMMVPAKASAAPALQSEQSPLGLEGTWRVQVTTYNCSTGVPAGPAFKSLLAFHRGGTLTGTTTNPAFQPGQRTSDFGVWSSNGGHTYTAASEAYILFTSAPNPPVPGFQKGTQRINQAISVDGDQFTSVATVQFSDVNGNTLFSGCASAVGQRFQ